MYPEVVDTISEERFRQLEDRSVNWNDRCPSPMELNALIAYIRGQESLIRGLRAEITRIKVIPSE